MGTVLSAGKRGELCFGSFETGNATYWEVRREAVRGKRTWLVYRTSVAVTLMGEYDSVDDAYAEFLKRVPRDTPYSDLESSMSR